MLYLYFSFAVVFMLNIFWAKVKYVAICCKVVFVYLWLCVSQIWSGCTFILICCYETLRAMAINDLHPDSYFRLFFCNSFIELSSPFDLRKFFSWLFLLHVHCPSINISFIFSTKIICSSWEFEECGREVQALDWSDMIPFCSDKWSSISLSTIIINGSASICFE